MFYTGWNARFALFAQIIYVWRYIAAGETALVKSKRGKGIMSRSQCD